MAEGKPKAHGGTDIFSRFKHPQADVEGIDVLVTHDLNPKVASAHKKTSKSLVENWILIKENSNATTWKKKFIKRNLLSERDIEAIGSAIKRSELAEWLIMKALQNVKTMKDIKLIETVISQDTGTLKTKTEDASQKESTETPVEVEKILLNHRCEIEDLLSREDAIAIKDHLVQDRIINLTENEYLLTQEKLVLDKKTCLITSVMDIVISKLSFGSYQCLSHSLETISNINRKQQITQILKNGSVASSMKSDWQLTRIENMKSKFCDRELDDKTDFKMKIKATKSSGLEAEEIYQHFTDNPETVDMIFVSKMAVSPGKKSKGSLVINFQLMEKNMQDYIKHCLRNGNVTTVVQMLFSNISLDYVDPSGELRVEVEIEVNEDSEKLESLPENSPEMNFVLHNRAFLIEEMDTDAMKECLSEKHGINLPTYQGMRRKKMASEIINHMLKEHEEDKITLVIRDNEMDGFGYLLERLETYEKVYTTESSCLRKNLLLQFSVIVSEVDIDLIWDFLIERRTVIEEIYLYSIGKCMATLLLKILKHGDALRAFVDALFMINWASAEKMLRWQSQVNFVERGSEVEICENYRGDNILFEGSFKVFINDTVAKEIRHRNNQNNQRQQLRNEMIQFEKTLYDWRKDAISVTATLQGLTDELDANFSRLSKSKIGGSVAGIVGGVLGIVGLSLAAFTFGASLGLTITGGVVAGLGGATVGGSLVADNVLSKKTMTKAKAEISNYSDASCLIKDKCVILGDQMKTFGKVEIGFPEWTEFWFHFVHGHDETTTNTDNLQWNLIENSIKASLRVSLVEAATFLSEGVGAGIRITGAAVRFTGASLHVVSGIVGILMIPLDIFTIVDSAIDVHKKNKHATSKIIINISDTLAKEIPTEENIQTLIRHTLNNMQV